jgi:Putative zinc-finger
MTCPSDATVAARLDGELTENEARSFDAHLSSCAQCRGRVARLQRALGELGAALQQPEQAEFVSEVLQQTSRPAPARWAPRAAILSAAMAAGIAGVMVVRAWTEPAPAPAGEGFVARGGSGGALSRVLGFNAYVHRGSDAARRHLLLAHEVIHVGDGFSFEVINRSGAPAQVLLFAIDAAGETHWFHPGWRAAESSPSSVVVPGSPSVLPLTEGVTPEGLAVGELQLIGVFGTAPLAAARVEQALRAGQLDGLERLFPGSAVQRLQLMVAPEGRP